MTERPIILRDHEVRAIVAGTKTQLRRLALERAPSPGYQWAECLCAEIDPSDRPCLTCEGRFGDSPIGAIGDTLWVRECHALIWPGEDLPERDEEYRADGDYDRLPGDWPAEMRSDPDAPRWRSSTQMPRWASRLTLKVTGVRVERLADATEEDAVAMGYGHAMNDENGVTALDMFFLSPDFTMQQWADNVWTWVVTFEVRK